MATNDEQRLDAFSLGVKKELKRLGHPRFSFTDNRTQQSWNINTDGWCVPLGRVEGVSGYLELWLDRTTNQDVRELCAAYTVHSHDDLIHAAAAALPLHLRPVNRFSSEMWAAGKNGELRFSQPLPRRLYDVTIAEYYGRSWSYLSRYWSGFVETGEAGQRRLLTQVSAFLCEMVEALAAIAVDADPEIYSKVENRKRVVQHLSRERSSALATKAKVRDNYTCQVCRIRFFDLYGPLGARFAEAHHLVRLASLEGPQHTHLDHLMTVCSNCHRMLHRLEEGGMGDVERLRSVLTGRWPKQSVT